jgi:hypothetical protein
MPKISPFFGKVGRLASSGPSAEQLSRSRFLNAKKASNTPQIHNTATTHFRHWHAWHGRELATYTSSVNPILG